MVVVGLAYLVVGVVTASLAGSAASHRMVVVWRLVAWLVSAVVFAAHIGFESLRLRSSVRTTALHASLGAALGAFGLAAAANVHALWVVRGWKLLHAVALVVWPVGTALPAFVVALAAAAWLARARRKAA